MPQARVGLVMPVATAVSASKHCPCLLLDDLNVVLFLRGSVSLIPCMADVLQIACTFHFSISSCVVLYCFSSSSSTFRNPSEFVFSAGMTSFTVRSTSTPLIMRKHLRLAGSGSRVSRTSLIHRQRGGVFGGETEPSQEALLGFRRSGETRSIRVGKTATGLEGRGSRTCALRLLARRRQSSAQSVGGYSCSSGTVFGALCGRVSF